ncbi:RNA-binding protein 45-like [Onthophagus taurus]|uniref:RNA-binding protein 45-like n=1 Tax=Onthophagus taurus TaxID=166361 RepID=UPI000C201434|nr:RNA-binding protein 45-like [Onthophagus taurus]
MGDRRASYGEHRGSQAIDNPPNSRLFVISSRQLTEDDFKEAFNKFGEIEEVWVVKDRQTGERKGYTYIKFSKTSEAAKALEAMNGKIIGNTGRHIKVVIASRRDQGSKREDNEDEKAQRLFILVPKTITEEELEEHFKQFGDIDNISIIRDRETKDNKGFAYVKYYKFSHAAIAYENCDRKYKAVFAEPKTNKRSSSTNDYQEPHLEPYENLSRNTSSSSLPLPDLPNGSGCSKLIVLTNPSVNQDQLWKLFDIVPGMDYCQLKMEGRPYPVRGVGTVVYSHPLWAAFAKEKLHGLEYPPGSRLIVKYEIDCGRQFPDRGGFGYQKPGDVKQLQEAIIHATALIHNSGLSPDAIQAKLLMRNNPIEEDDYALDLPNPQPLLHVDDPVAARCFIVCMPTALPLPTLRDLFCRFGNLIEVYMLQNKNCGYAKYGRKESAENAIRMLHGIDIGGIRLKVMKAEERDTQPKRLKLASFADPYE